MVNGILGGSQLMEATMLKWTVALACSMCSTWVLTTIPGCTSTSAPGSAPATQPASVSPHPNIDARADADLFRMGKTLGEAKTFKLHSTATIEERLESGQLAHFSRDSVLILSRPDGLSAEVKRGAETHRFWHKGKQLTVLDVRQNRYSTIDSPEHIDDMLDDLAEEHGIVVPLDDLLYPDPYKVLTERVKTGAFVDQQDIDGHPCDHLLFTQDNVDWQIWIDAGTSAVPRKVVITEKGDPDRPQYEAVLDGWEFNLPLSATQFDPQLPPTATSVDLSDLTDDD
jgi:hypothetical protein